MGERERAGENDIESPGRASAPRDLQGQIAALAAQVRRLAERRQQAAVAARGAAEQSDATVEALGETILATAEAVAAEIRASAEREAQRLREGTAREADRRSAALRAILAQHRESLAALTAEADRIEHSAALLRAQTRALQAELMAIEESIAGIVPPRS
jgi:chromosome segregation ATPase